MSKKNKSYRSNNYSAKSNNYGKNKDKFESTTRIRIDKERLDDIDSLDTSFLEGRLNNKKNVNRKKKSKILRSKSTKKHYYKYFKRLFYLLGTLCFIVLICLLFFNFNSMKSTHTKKHLPDENKTEIKEKIIDDNYLFIGDFYTVEFDFSEYDFDYHYVKECSEKYRLVDLKDEMKKKVYQYNPSIVFIQLGFNDYMQDRDDIIANLKEIISMIKENRPYCEIYVESFYPINNKIDGYDSDEFEREPNNEDIIDLNNKIMELSKKEKVHYVDFFSELSEDNQLKEEYTDDGVHLNKDGYKRVVKIINRIVDDNDGE